MNNEEKLFTRPREPFLLLYESREDGLSIARFKAKEDLIECVDEVKRYASIVDAIEIGSCRNIDVER